MERNARHLESLVSDLLMLARLEAELPASFDTVNVKGLVDEQLAQRQAAIAERNLRVVNECPEVELYADRVRLGTALSNLIDNAVYYNRPSGEIRVSGVQENSVVSAFHCRYRRRNPARGPSANLRTFLSRGQGADARLAAEPGSDFPS